MNQDVARHCPICGSNSQAEGQPVRWDDRYGYPGKYELSRCERCGHRHLDAHFSSMQLRALYSGFYPRAELTPEEFAARRTSFFPSIKATLNRLHSAVFICDDASRVLHMNRGRSHA